MFEARIIKNLELGLAATRDIRKRDVKMAEVRAAEALKDGGPVDRGGEVSVTQTATPQGPVNVIDNLAVGQVFLTLQRGERDSIQYRAIGPGPKKGDMLLLDESSELFPRSRSMLSEARVGRRRMYAVRDNARLLNGEYQHMRLDVNDDTYWAMPRMKRDLERGETYVLRQHMEGELIENNVQLLDADAVFRALAAFEFRNLDDPAKLIHIARDGLRSNPNAGTTIYPNPDTFRSVIVRGREWFLQNGKK